MLARLVTRVDARAWHKFLHEPVAQNRMSDILQLKLSISIIRKQIRVKQSLRQETVSIQDGRCRRSDDLHLR